MTVLLIVAYLLVTYGAARWLWRSSEWKNCDKPLVLALASGWPVTVPFVLTMRSLPSKGER